MHDAVKVVRSVFTDGNKYYPQIFLDVFFCKLAE